MNAPRCWPGAICRIVRSMAGNERRRVVVLNAAGHADLLRLEVPRLVRLADVYLWMVQPLQPLNEKHPVLGMRQIVTPIVMPDCWLEPIADPDGLDETLQRAGLPEYAHG